MIFCSGSLCILVNSLSLCSTLGHRTCYKLWTAQPITAASSYTKLPYAEGPCHAVRAYKSLQYHSLCLQPHLPLISGGCFSPMVWLVHPLPALCRELALSRCHWLLIGKKWRHQRGSIVGGSQGPLCGLLMFTEPQSSSEVSILFLLKWQFLTVFTMITNSS